MSNNQAATTSNDQAIANALVSEATKELYRNATNPSTRADFWFAFLTELVPLGLMPRYDPAADPSYRKTIKITTVFGRVFMSGLIRFPSDRRGSDAHIREAFQRAQGEEHELTVPWLFFLGNKEMTFYEGEVVNGAPTRRYTEAATFNNPLGQVLEIQKYLEAKWDELPLDQKI